LAATSTNLFNYRVTASISVFLFAAVSGKKERLDIAKKKDFGKKTVIKTFIRKIKV
jgi:hypothetical protein